MHGFQNRVLTHFPTVSNTVDKAFLARHVRRFAQSLIRKYETLGEDYKGMHRFDAKKQTLKIYLMRMPLEEVADLELDNKDAHYIEDTQPITDAQIILDVGLKKTMQGRRLQMVGEITNPVFDDVIKINSVMGSDPVQETEKFLGAIVEHDFIDNDEALRFLPETDAQKDSKRRRRWSVREKFVRVKIDNLRRAFLQEQGHLYKNVKFAVKPDQQTFRLTFHAKRAFEGRHVVIEGSYKLNGWDQDKCRPAKMTMNIGRTSIRRDFELAAGLDQIDLAIDNRHEDAVSHISYILHQAKALSVNVDAERVAKKERRDRPSREERATGNRARRRTNRTAAHIMGRRPS